MSRLHPLIPALFAALALAPAGWAADAPPAGHHPGAMHGHGHARPAAPLQDTRQALAVTPEEAAYLRLEMRAFLSGVQKIVTGAAASDMKTVAESARELGMAATHEVPPGLRARLPLEFKHLGHSTHMAFDDLARDADSLADPAHSLRQLSAAMQYCLSCHATFRLKETAAPRGKAR